MTASRWDNAEVREELYNDCVDHWGADSQHGMLNEELAELIVAVLKYTNRKPTIENYDHMAEEMGDVLLMVEQMMTHHDKVGHPEDTIGFKARVKHWMQLKCDRTELRLADSIARRYPEIQ